MKHYSKKNGYYKYYSKSGLSCRIKIDESAMHKKNSSFTIFWTNGNEWNAHIPTASDRKSDKVFSDVFDVINHILKNLEHENLVFKVMR